MSTTVTIPKTPNLLPDQDYNALRQQGMQYLQGMATALWTDFNEHDPGITMLEALCYAITELGYRTSFPMANLLTQADGTLLPGQCFFTPKEIMTINPLTPRDYRKLLVDLEGVENAWLQYTGVGQEVNFYADCDKDQLSINDGKVIVPLDHVINLSGLYKAIVDLQPDASLGDLNNSNITYRVPAAGSLQNQVVTFVFSDLEALDPTTYQQILTAVTTELSSIVSLQVTRTNNQYYWSGNLVVKLTSGNVNVPIDIRIDSIASRTDIAAATTYLNATLFSNLSLVQQIFQQYQQKITLIADNLMNVRRVLLAHRNLCEDFKDVVTVTDQELAICMDIDVATGADLNNIQAQIFFQVQAYLSPTVNFYSLQDLISQGIPIDQIFDGPVLTHGFINNTELDNAQLVSIVRTSALVKIIMGIEGVNSVRNVAMTLYQPNGQPITPSETSCVVIPAGCKGLLNTDRSNITFYIGKIPLEADMSETLDIMRYLEAVQSQNKLYGTESDLPLPTGTYYNLGDYYSVQNDMPQTYGIGRAGLPPTASTERVAQAWQLKAYLMFFDQMLANFFSQLQGAGRLLSTDPTLVQTYFTQYLGPSAPPYYQDGVKNVDLIYLDTDTGMPGTSKVASLMGGQEIGSTDWQTLVEAETTFASRRNAFLDHLLSRFAESFSEYALMMYTVDFQLQESELQSDAALIQSKINFLNQYPSISKNRGKALNYCPLLIDTTTDLPILNAQGVPTVHTGLTPSDPARGGLWDAWNMAGLAKRASLLSGIALPRGIEYAQYVFSPSMGEVLSVNNNNQSPYYFAFFDGSGTARLTSIKQTYTNQTAASTDLATASAAVATAANYTVTASGSNFVLNLVVSGSAVATDGVNYTTEAAAQTAVNDLVQLFTPNNVPVALPSTVEAGDFGFAFQNASGAKVLISVLQNYTSETAALADGNLLPEYLNDPYAYSVVASGTSFVIYLSAAGVPLATDGITYATTAAAQTAINNLVAYFSPTFNNLGFYLVEHILLRPRTDAFELMGVCLGNDCSFCGEQDPYTFRASVVMPYWPEEFEDLDFRTYFENTIMAEAPAQVSLKICWVNNSSMRQFEIAYRTWLNALAQVTADPEGTGLMTAFQKANDNLINIMQNFHSEYPLAVLHDCEESQTDNVVLLGSTVLGTYKN
jgi:hypothetical protein